jgi:DNA-binding beta-propeller fold protein YncE
MNRTARVAALAALGLTAAVAFAAPAAARPTEHGAHQPALFVQTDALDGNSVVAYARALDGTLLPTGSFATGGLGGSLTGAVVDHQASQGALQYDRAHRLLFATNAGSDTVTVFRVEGTKLHRIQTVGSGGSFPNSVTVHGNVLYVLNARGGGSVQGFVILGERLVRIPAWRRALGLGPSAAPEFTHTPGQVAFDPSGTRLIVTTKAATSSVDVFRVGRFGALSAAPTVTPLPGAVPFAIAFDPQGRAVIAEAGTNSVAVFDLASDDTLTPVSSAATGQNATCWIVADGANVYVSNAGSATLSGYRIAADDSLIALGNTATGAGTVDAALSPDGAYLYVQTGAAGNVDEFAVQADGSLSPLGSVTVPGAVGGEGIATA